MVKQNRQTTPRSSPMKRESYKGKITFSPSLYNRTVKKVLSELYKDYITAPTDQTYGRAAVTKFFLRYFFR